MNLYPSPFKAGDRFTFENQHGRCVLEALTDPQPIRGLDVVTHLPKEHWITFDQIEQIALITDQVRLQPFVPWMDLKKLGLDFNTDPIGGYLRHATGSTCACCKVIELAYTNKTSAKDQIADDLFHGRNRLPV